MEDLEVRDEVEKIWKWKKNLNTVQLANIFTCFGMILLFFQEKEW